MKTYLYTTAVALLATAAITVNAEQIIAQTYPISDVSELNVFGAAVVEITQGETESLRAEATPEIMKRINVDLTNHKLTLGVKGEHVHFFDWFNNDNGDVKFIVQIKKLNALDVSGAVQLSMGNFRGEKLNVTMSGAAKSFFSALEINNLALELSGAANANLQTLIGQKASVELSGASTINVHMGTDLHTLM